MNLQEAGCEDMDWVDLAEDMDRWRAVVKHRNEPWGSTKFGEFSD
jgi:hypothetical protein